MNQNKKYLCLDYGDKHIGVAVAVTIFAEPIEVMQTVGSVSAIKKYVDKYGITDIVIGLSENQTALKTREFARHIAEVTKLPIHFQDETLSSQDTRRQMAMMGIKRSVREAKIDHYVAARILQEFLDSHSDTIT